MERPSFIQARDAKLMAGLPLTMPFAFWAPDRVEEAVCRRIAGAVMRARPSKTAIEVDRLRRKLGNDARHDCAGAIQGLKANFHLSRLYFWRCCRPGGWNPEITLRGREHVDAVRALGKGAVLWIGHSPWRHLITKMAFHRAGFAVSHLSHFDHGFCRSRLGIRTVNALQIAIEGRYLKERVIVDDPRGNPIGPIRAIERRLAQNGLVSIVANASSQHIVDVTFLDGTLKLPVGPAKIALRTGAGLLPAFSIRNTDGTFETTIGPPIGPSPGLPRERALIDSLAAYARFLEGYARQWPDQFCGWDDVDPPPTAH